MGATLCSLRIGSGPGSTGGMSSSVCATSLAAPSCSYVASVELYAEGSLEFDRMSNLQMTVLTDACDIIWYTTGVLTLYALCSAAQAARTIVTDLQD